ncbi:MAG: phage portal protein, partial [Acidobacteriota bacterium]|nr:phage portal protein [Acidobacteriota bacterium]
MVPRLATPLTRLAEQQKSRQSTVEDQSQAKDYIGPPYDLNALTQLLEQSPDYYAVVDQLATDVAGLGWDLIDSDVVDEFPTAGDIEAEDQLDQAAAKQRAEATRYLESIVEDFSGRRMRIRDLAKCAFMDYDSTGMGYVEVSRDETGKIDGLFHVPSRLMRIRTKEQGGGFVQVNEQGQVVGYFRDWLSKPDDKGSHVTEQESRGRGAGRQKVGELKNEIFMFRRHHPKEPYYGVPPIVAALFALYGNLYTDQRNLRFFINRGVPDYLITVKAPVSYLTEGTDEYDQIQEFIEEIKEQLEHLVEGDDHRTIVVELPSGEVEVDFDRIIDAPKDQDFEVYQLRNRDIQLRVYRMLPHRVGIVETASLGTGTGETQEETYKRAQVDSRQQLFEDFMDEVLDQLKFTAVRFKFLEIDILDEEREARIYVGIASRDVLSLNEERRWVSRIVKDQDFPPWDDDDMADVPRWMLVAQGVMAPTPGFGALALAPGAIPVDGGDGAIIGEDAATAIQRGPSRATGPPDRGFVDVARRVAEGTSERRAARRRAIRDRHRGGVDGGRGSAA